MCSKCHLIGQCLLTNFETILEKDSLSRGGVIAEILHGGIGKWWLFLCGRCSRERVNVHVARRSH